MLLLAFSFGPYTDLTLFVLLVQIKIYTGHCGFIVLGAAHSLLSVFLTCV